MTSLRPQSLQRTWSIARVSPYVLLDAGGTLVCPDADLLARVASERGHHVEPPRVIAAFFERVHRLDVALRDGLEAPAVDDFLADLLSAAGVPDDDARVCLDLARARVGGARSLWTFALPGVAAALEALATGGLSMSVLSNADGTVAAQMRDLGFAPYFEHVFDSHEIGLEKPDPAAFRYVLDKLDLAPAECLYVGDVVMVDLVGANRCGIPAIHLDPLGLYRDWPGIHLRRLADLPTVLGSGSISASDPRLHAYAPPT